MNGESKRMKVLLIMPDGRIHKVHFGPFVKSMREVPLTLSTLAASVDASLVDLELVDESVGEDPFNKRADLVGISVLTGNAPRAYRIAEHYRERGVTVVMGGVHATLMPLEVKEHCDAVVMGAAERTFPRLLNDFVLGRLCEIYGDDDEEQSPVCETPIARRDLHSSRKYMIPNAVFATRGCRHSCDFCSAAAVHRKYERRPIPHVLRDIQSMKKGFFIFNDVSLVDDLEYAKELFSALIPLKRKWAGLGTVEVADDAELLDLMERSGCRGLLIGFESLRRESLKEIHKSCNTVERYKQVVGALHDHSIAVQGTFMFGFDSDDEHVFDDTVEGIQEIGVDIPRFSVLTPHPGTRLFKKMLGQGRILSFDWSDYDTMHVVFQPAKMSAPALYDGFKRAYTRSYEFKRIFGRMRGGPINRVIGLVGNLTYRRFAKALRTDPHYAQPYNREAGQCSFALRLARQGAL